MDDNEIVDDRVPDPPKDMNATAMQLIRGCAKFLSHDDVRLGKKFDDLNSLYSMWTEATAEDYSAEVYARVTVMFASNVFRPLPPSSYATPINETTGTAVGGDGGGGVRPVVDANEDDPEASRAAETEFLQTSMVHQVFQAFVARERFDADRARPHLDRRFANGLVLRLGSDDAAERQIVRDTVVCVWRSCRVVRGRVLHAAVTQLADFAYGYAPWLNGVDSLLDFFADTVEYTDIEWTVFDRLCRILKQLLKHQLLFLFKSKFVECAKTLNARYQNLIPRMLFLITKIWSNQNVNTTALLGAMIDLYGSCDKNKWIQVQLPVVGHLCKLFSDDSFQLADGSMNFWYTVLHDNIEFWQNRPAESDVVADALKNVIRTHWNEDCVRTAKSLLYVMALKNVIEDGGDAGGPEAL